MQITWLFANLVALAATVAVLTCGYHLLRPLVSDPSLTHTWWTFLGRALRMMPGSFVVFVGTAMALYVAWSALQFPRNVSKWFNQNDQGVQTIQLEGRSNTFMPSIF